MNFRRINLVVVLFGMISIAIAEDNQAEFDQFVGRWEGRGHFYNVDFSSEYGDVTFDISISENLEISGFIGAANISGAELTVDTWNDGFKIEAKIQDKIFSGKDYDKDCIVFLLKAPKGDQIDGDFHVMSNFIFDFGMRPGAINLHRVP